MVTFGSRKRLDWRGYELEAACRTEISGFFRGQLRQSAGDTKQPLPTDG
jgi:hypothetical protein